jgi:hypothetical protein
MFHQKLRGVTHVNYGGKNVRWYYHFWMWKENVCVCVCVCRWVGGWLCERSLLAEVVGVDRTCVLRNGTVAYLLIYSSDTCLHNAHHSLSLSLSLSLSKRVAHKSVRNYSITFLKRNLLPSRQIHDELLILLLTCSIFLFLCFFRADSGPETDSGDHSDWKCKYELFSHVTYCIVITVRWYIHVYRQKEKWNYFVSLCTKV